MSDARDVTKRFEEFARGYRVEVQARLDGPGDGWWGRLWRDGVAVAEVTYKDQEYGAPHLDFFAAAEQKRFDRDSSAAMRGADVLYFPDVDFIQRLEKAATTFKDCAAVGARQPAPASAPAAEPVVVIGRAPRTWEPVPELEATRWPDTPENRARAVAERPGWVVVNDHLARWANAEAASRPQATTQAVAAPAPAPVAKPRASRSGPAR